jgi:hypothetical protein
MVLGLAVLLISSVHLGFEDFNPRYCPSDALGYVRFVKDGVRVADGDAKYRSGTDTLIAWFPPDWTSAKVIVTLEMRPGVNLQLHTAGRGVIRMRHGTFCVFGFGVPVWREWFPRVSPTPSH